MKLFLLPALLALIFAALPASAQQIQSHPLVTITGTATVEGTTAAGFPKTTPIAISNAAIFKALNVNQGKKPDYALLLDTGLNQIVLRALRSADAASFLDKVLLDFSSTTTTDAEVDNAATGTRYVFSRNIAGGASAKNTVFASLAGSALISVYTPPNRGGFGHYPPPNVLVYKVSAKGHNPTVNATNFDALLQFRITTGKQFQQQ